MHRGFGVLIYVIIGIFFVTPISFALSLTQPIHILMSSSLLIHTSNDALPMSVDMYTVPSIWLTIVSIMGSPLPQNSNYPIITMGKVHSEVDYWRKRLSVRFLFFSRG